MHKKADMSEIAIRGPRKQVFDTTKMLDLLSTGKFADFDLTCGDHTFSLHRAILVQSEFLNRMTSGPFKESFECKGKLSEEDPALLARFLMFLYTGWYDHGDVSKTSSVAQFKNIEDVYATDDEVYGASSLHVGMIGLAHRLCEERLRVHCLQRLGDSFWKKRKPRTLTAGEFPTRGEVVKINLCIQSHPSHPTPTQLEVGLDNSGQEFYEFMSEVTDWGYFKIQINNEDKNYLRNEPRSLRQMGFAGDQIINIVKQTFNRRFGELQLECLERGYTAIQDPREAELVKHIYENRQDEPLMWEMVCTDYRYRRTTRGMTSCSAYVDLVRCIPDLCFEVELMQITDKFFSCTECDALQFLVVHVCECGQWLDRCEKHSIIPKMEETTCFSCFTKGKLQETNFWTYDR